MELLTRNIARLLAQVAGKVFPDQEKAKAAQLEVLRMAKSGDLETLIGQVLASEQMRAGKANARTPDLLTRGWRPFIGWVCGFALVYQMIARPLLNGLAGTNCPDLDMGTLLTLLFSMLGLGGLRTTEKIKGVA